MALVLVIIMLGAAYTMTFQKKSATPAEGAVIAGGSILALFLIAHVLLRAAFARERPAPTTPAAEAKRMSRQPFRPNSTTSTGRG